MDNIFIPHGELLTAVYIMYDPIYLTQPFVYSYLYTRSVARPVAAAYPPCIVNYEGVPEGDVPFYMPGKNSLTDQMMQIYHIPVYASQGGADTRGPRFPSLIAGTVGCCQGTSTLRRRSSDAPRGRSACISYLSPQGR